MLELLPIIRRWPSVAAALSVHVLALAAVLLSPDGASLRCPTVVDLLPLPHPHPMSPGASTAQGGSPGARTRVEKRFVSEPPAQPADATPEPSVREVALSAEASPSADSTFREDEGSAPFDGLSDGLSDGDAAGDGSGVGTGVGTGVGLGEGGDDDISRMEPIRMSSQVEPPRLVHRVEPTFPKIALVHGVEGEVVLECIIGIDGSVRVQRVAASVPLLDAAAVAAVTQWRYEPAQRDGHPQAVFLFVRLTFSARR